MPALESNESEHLIHAALRLQHIFLPGRKEALPEVYTVEDHPLVFGSHGRIFVLLQDQENNSLQAAQAAAQEGADGNLRDAHDVHGLGYPILDANEDEYVFLRNKAGTKDPRDDVLVVFTMQLSRYSPNIRNRLREIQLEIRGNASEIKAEKPGIAFERLARAQNNGRGERCYGLGTSFQDQTQLTAPFVAMKAGKSESMGLVRKIIETGASCAMKGLRDKAPGLADILDRQAILHNTPRVGVHENTSYPNRGLKDLGSAGTAHRDTHDSHVGLTCMINLSKPEENVNPEIFVIYGLGIACRMEEFNSLYFPGLYLHGGIPPTYRLGKKPEDASIYYRLTLICYPPKDILHNNGSLAFAQHPVPPMRDARVDELMKKTNDEMRKYLKGEFKREARVMRYDSQMRDTWFPTPNEPSDAGQATFLRDGCGMMQRKSYANLVSSGFLQVLTFFLCQADRDCDIRIDHKKFFEAISYTNDNGERSHPDPEILQLLTEAANSNVQESDEPVHNHVSPTACQERSNDYLEEVKKKCNRVLSMRKAAIGEIEKLGNKRRKNDSKNGARTSSRKPIPGKQSRAIQKWDKQVEKEIYSSPPISSYLGSDDEDFTPDSRKRKRSSSDIQGFGTPKKRKSTGGQIGLARSGGASESDSRGGGSSFDYLASTESEPAKKDGRVSEIGGTRRSARLKDSGKSKAPSAIYPPPGTQEASDSTSESSDMRIESSTSTLGSNAKTAANVRKNSHAGIQYVSLSIEDVISIDRLLGLTPDVSLPTTKVADIHVEMRLPDNPAMLMRCLASNLNVIAQAQGVLSTSQQVLMAKKLLINQLWWDTLQCEIRESQNLGHWLSQFRRRVEDLYYQKQRTTILRAEIHPSFEGVSDSDMASKYTYSCTTYRTSKNQHSSIDDQMLAILSHFFKRPLTEQYQAIFTREIVEFMGPAAVFLEPIQSFSAAIEFRLHLPAHPNLGQLKENCHDIARQASSQLLHMDEATIMLQRFNTEIPNKLHCFQKLFTETARFSAPPTIVPRTPASEQSEEYSIQAFGSRDFHNFPVDDHPRIRTLALLIFLLLPLLHDYPRTHFSPAHRAYLEFVESESDLRLPFRDMAASRSRILQNHGPFSTNHVATKEGFFSALIYRGITHRTQFLQDQKTLFANLDDWKTNYNRIKSDASEHGDRYFCRKDAYGSPSSARKPENAETYWKAATSTNLRPSAETSFGDFFEKIKNSEDTPAFGALTAYLLATDYTIAGVLKKPSIRQLGQILHKIGLGSKDGLKILGYSCSDTSATAVAFREVDTGLSHFLTDEEKKIVSFGGFFVEHVLCKLSRFKSSKEFHRVCEEWNVPLIKD